MGRPLRRAPIVVLGIPVIRAASLTLPYFPLLYPSTASSTSCSHRSSWLIVLFRGIRGRGREIGSRTCQFVGANFRGGPLVCVVRCPITVPNVFWTLQGLEVSP